MYHEYQVTGSEVCVKTDCPVRRKKTSDCLCSVNLSSLFDGAPKMGTASTDLPQDQSPGPLVCGATSGHPCRDLDLHLLSAQLETTFLEELFVLQKATNRSHDSMKAMACRTRLRYLILATPRGTFLLQ